MSYLMVVLLSIAPFISAVSVDQLKPDAGVKKGAIQTQGSPKQQKPEQKQAPGEPEQATKVVCYSCPVQTPVGQTEKQDTYDPRKDTLYRAYLWFTILGVPIALGGLFFIYRQVRHASQQTANLERQIAIQQRSSRQWVNVSEWRQHPVPDRPDTIEISFQIENPTPIPLRLDMVMCRASGQSNDSGLVTFLAPDNPFPHQMYVGLNAEQMALYQQNKLVLDVEVSVFFTDAFDNQWNQIFSRIIVCGMHDNYIYVRESRTRMRRSGPNDPHEE